MVDAEGMKKGRCSFIKRKASVRSLWSCWPFFNLLDFQEIIILVFRHDLPSKLKLGNNIVLFKFHSAKN